MTRRTAALLAPGLCFALVFSGLALAPPKPRLIWNASASAPVGLYRVEPVARPRVGDWVAIQPPPRLARLASERGYLPLGLPMIKRIAAGPGARVCRIGLSISIEGKPVASAEASDRFGRAMPVWQGCQLVASDELFLLNPHPASLDGRYTGPVPRAGLIGRVYAVRARDILRPTAWAMAREGLPNCAKTARTVTDRSQ